jgi:hypothetical protein
MFTVELGRCEGSGWAEPPEQKAMLHDEMLEGRRGFGVVAAGAGTHVPCGAVVLRTDLGLPLGPVLDTGPSLVRTQR